jgi:hypothetical protein
MRDLSVLRPRGDLILTEHIPIVKQLWRVLFIKTALGRRMKCSSSLLLSCYLHPVHIGSSFQTRDSPDTA